MKLNYELTEKDYIDFTVYHHQSSESYQKQSLWLRFVMPAVFMPVIVLIGTAIFNQSIYFWLIVAIGFYAYWAIPFNKRHRKLLSKEIKMSLGRMDNRSLLGQKNLEILEGSIIIHDDVNQEVISKSVIQDIIVNGDVIYVYISSVQAVLIVNKDTGYTTEAILKALK